MILAHRGRLTLHASAIKVGVGALAFAGKAGWGKSTLCAAFARMGSTPLADDCLVIGERRGRLVAVPGYPGLRLWPDAARALKNGRGRRRTGDSTGKRRHQVTPAQRLPESVALRAVYVLTAPGAARRTRIRRLGPHEIVGRLLAHTHRLDVSDRDRLVRELEALSRLARRVPVFELTCPRGLHRLAAVRAAVLRHAAAEA